MNTLLSNAAANAVTVNVYVRAGDDFQVLNPHDSAMNGLTYFPFIAAGALLPKVLTFCQQGEGEIVDNVPEESAAKVDIIAPEAPSLMERKLAVFGGDALVSFRSMLKRYVISEVVVSTLGTVAADKMYEFQYIEPNFPRQPGCDPNGHWTINTGEAFGLSKMTLLNLLAPAFTGYRGSLRVKYVPVGLGWNQSLGSDTYVHRMPVNSYSAYGCVESYGKNSTSTTANPAPACFERDSAGFSALSSTVMNQQHCMAIDLPFISRKRFALAQMLDLNIGTDWDDSRSFWHRINSTRSSWSGTDAASTQSFGFKKYVSVGDDFNLHYFNSAPIMFKYTAATTILSGPSTIAAFGPIDGGP
jgi:hypothetical protein